MGLQFVIKTKCFFIYTKKIHNIETQSLIYNINCVKIVNKLDKVVK